jgi:hypothetical protein
VVGLIGLAIYGVFFRTDHSKNAPITEASLEWYDLGSCTETRSLDGKRRLSLEEDKKAELHETIQTEAKTTQQTISGNWSYDPAARRYTVNIDGGTTSYSLINERDVPGCMLVKGTLAQANLLESWFATTDDEPPADDGRDDYRARD